MSENTNSPDTNVVRDTPKPPQGRRELVSWWNAQVEGAKTKYEDDFNRMRLWQRFAKGDQWPSRTDERYVVNVTLRQLRQRTAQLYAKNPKAVARVRKRLDHTTWDGTTEAVMRAQQTLQMAQQAAPALLQTTDEATRMAVQAQVQQAQAVLQDYSATMQFRQQRAKMGETLEVLYDYNIDEQALPFKTMMKLTVLRALTTGVGWVKLGFQRATRMTPDIEGRMRDLTDQLLSIEQKAADLADGEIEKDSKEAEALRLEIQNLEANGQILLREGLTFDYPGSTCIIPDPNCKHLKSFMGCAWVAQEYFLHPQQIQQIYNVDVSSSKYVQYNGLQADNGVGASIAYAGAPTGAGLQPQPEEDPEHPLALVREIYCKADGLVYVVCDGYPEFLQEPAEPEIWMERFYPWFGIIFNEVDEDDDEYTLFPPSDVELIAHPQREINRSREALREHRIANRPAYGAAGGMLSDQDKQKLETRPPHAIVELQGMQPGQSVEDVMAPIRPAPLDPALYDVNPQYDDILRSGGLQEANLGGVSGATATESSIAQASMSATNNSAVDDLDEVLTLLARAGSQILLDNVSRETVMQIVGRGALWPDMSRAEIARELWLEIEAGSTGRPNQAQEIANAERIAPLLLQIPGISPEWLAQELVRRLDDRLDLSQATSGPLQSIVAMNAQRQPATGSPATDPAQQGGQGGLNAQPGPAPSGPAEGVSTVPQAPQAPPPGT